MEILALRFNVWLLTPETVALIVEVLLQIKGVWALVIKLDKLTLFPPEIERLLPDKLNVCKGNVTEFPPEILKVFWLIAKFWIWLATDGADTYKPLLLFSNKLLTSVLKTASALIVWLLTPPTDNTIELELIGVIGVSVILLELLVLTLLANACNTSWIVLLIVKPIPFISTILGFFIALISVLNMFKLLVLVAQHSSNPLILFVLLPI